MAKKIYKEPKKVTISVLGGVSNIKAYLLKYDDNGVVYKDRDYKPDSKVFVPYTNIRFIREGH